MLPLAIGLHPPGAPHELDVRPAEEATVKVTEFSITPKPKPGAFKGCL